MAEAVATGVRRIAEAFAGAREQGRAALMPYLMGGFPDAETVAGRRRSPTPRRARTWSSSGFPSPIRSPTAR